MNNHGNKQSGLDSLLKSFFSSRYTDWRPNLLHGMSTAVFVGSRTVDSLLPLLTPHEKLENLCKTLRNRV